jgi:hypothetical protein
LGEQELFQDYCLYVVILALSSISNIEKIGFSQLMKTFVKKSSILFPKKEKLK